MSKEIFGLMNSSISDELRRRVPVLCDASLYGNERSRSVCFETRSRDTGISALVRTRT